MNLADLHAINDLMEAYVRSDWVLEEERAFRAVAREYDFVLQSRPFYDVGPMRWIFGGELKGDKIDSMIPIEDRVGLLRHGIGLHLLELAKNGRNPRIEPRGRKNASWWQAYGGVPYIIYHNDTMARISGILKDRIFLNHKSGQENPETSVFFYYTLDIPGDERRDPSPPKVPKKQVPRKPGA